MLMRKLLSVVCPLLLCLLACVLFRWLDTLAALKPFFQYLLKGVLLGLCVALLLPVAGISVQNTGLTGLLFVAAGLLALTLGYQYLETEGILHWPTVRTILSINGQVVLVEGTVAGFLTLSAVLSRKRRG
jgi:hypothetical protein